MLIVNSLDISGAAWSLSDQPEQEPLVQVQRHDRGGVWDDRREDYERVLRRILQGTYPGVFVKLGLDNGNTRTKLVGLVTSGVTRLDKKLDALAWSCVAVYYSVSMRPL